MFADTFKGLTFYIGQKEKNIVKNIFIKDEGNTLNNLLPNKKATKNKTIIAERGIINKNKIILEKGFIQTFEENNTVKIVQFNKTLLNFENLDNRVIKVAKIQETSTGKVLSCLKNYYYKNFSNEIIKNCPKNNISIVIETFSRRVVMPLYIPLISIIVSFLLIHKKNKKLKIFNRYIFFSIGFFLLVMAELLVRYSGMSSINFYIYLFTPFILMPVTYFILLKNFKRELQ